MPAAELRDEVEMTRGLHRPALGPASRRPASARPGNTPPRPSQTSGTADRSEVPADPLARDASLAMLEAALLAADEPLPLRKLLQVTGLLDTSVVRRLLRKLREMYDADQTAFQLEEIAGGYQLLTRPEYARWLNALHRHSPEFRLTAAARETLAIIAYRQPIMRANIEAIRGVHCGETLRLLMEKGLVKITGRDDTLGRPVLYGTTRKFLQIYGLRSVKDLPRLTEG